MPQVEWHARAINDVERLYVFLKTKDQFAAQKMAHVLSHGASLLGEVPGIGRPMNDNTNRRELYVPFGASAYVIRYINVDDKIILILRVWHSKEGRM